MMIWDVMTASQLMPFTVALALMLCLALMEGVMSVILGAGLSHIFGSVLPDVDFLAPSVGEPGGVGKLLGWMQIGKVPVMVLLFMFLTAFGLLGVVGQMLIHAVAGFYLPAWLAVGPVFFLALPPTRWGAGLIRRVLPDEETSAVSTESFIGKVAVITLGVAREGFPAEGRLSDEFGRHHYVMVEPDAGGEMAAGASVLIIGKSASGTYLAIPNPNEHLVDK